MPESQEHPPEDDFSAPVANRQLPTRVSSACPRCRRNKSRCDAFRPCSLCVRANVECEVTPSEEALKNRPKGNNERRYRKQQRRPQSRSDGDAPSTSTTPTQRPLLARETTAVESGEREDISEESQQQNSWMQVDYGGSESAMGIARKMYRLGSQPIDEHQTSAIPDGGCGSRTPMRRIGDRRLPISTILGGRFPDYKKINVLLEDYFEAVHWFSLVIYEPRFRQRVLSIKDGCAYHTDASFLTLLSMVLSMAAWYRSKRAAQDGDDWSLWSDELLQIVESRLIYTMDQHCISAVQTLILLGSHHVYHGRPNMSFALLGATIKIAQAMGLHRGQKHRSVDDAEERKRVWWTIYTWDRFASISYGRPLSINDDDCSVEMPTEFAESPSFTPESVEKNYPDITYSPYQTELNKLYLIASPALKMIFGSFSAQSANQSFGSKYDSLVSNMTQRLLRWQRELPSYLSLDLNQDYCPGSTGWSMRVRLLQSLSLQLTFDNLLIVLHRPCLARQIETLSIRSPMGDNSVAGLNSSLGQTPRNTNQVSPSSQSPGFDMHQSSEHWWNAAVRTARVTELPQLTQLATDSHLVAFMAMNLFHAAIVLILVALSDPLADSAQAVKRPITRVFRLQELLGKRSALSSQSSVVLKNLVCLFLRREAEAMIGPATSNRRIGGEGEHRFREDNDSGPLLVERAVNAPVEAALNTSFQGIDQTASIVQRFNESLASVQQIIPSSHDESIQSGFMAATRNDGSFSEEPAHLQQQQPTWPTPMLQPVGFQQHAESFSNDAAVVDNGTNGFFWLWDSTWSGSV